MRKLLGVSLGALLIVVGCKPPQQFGGVPRDKVYRAVISLSPSTTELMAQYAIPIIGRSKADDYPVAIKATPVVGDLKPDYEAITRMHPDIIVVDRDLYGDAEIKKLESITEVLKIGSDSLDAFIKESYEIGNKLGGEGAITEYVDKINRQRQASEGEKPPTPVNAVMVIPDSSGHHMIAGVKSFQCDLVKIMGATPIGPDSNKFEMLNPEFLMSQNPDVVIVAGEAKSFLADKRFANLKAVKSGKIFGLPQDYVLRRGARIDQTIYQGHKALMLVTKGK